MFQSAPGSMSRENMLAARIAAAENPVSIRSRLDEPGERERVWALTPVAVFQSAPGSMSRENLKLRDSRADIGVSIRSRLDEPGEQQKLVVGAQGGCFNPLPAR